MCTVTYIPTGDKVYISSNRDEQLKRKPALPPDIYPFNSGKLLFPKDGEKGGTWVAMHPNGNMMVLLNGGFEPHIPDREYIKSRGLVFLDVFDTPYPKYSFEDSALHGVEPFTLVLWQSDAVELWEMRWDGKDKHITQKDENKPQIWSSVTLYDKPVIEKRESWFEQWIGSVSDINVGSVSHFHEFGGEGNKSIDLHMSRGGILETVSITVMESVADKSVMYYKDMITGARTMNEWLRAPKAPAI